LVDSESVQMWCLVSRGWGRNTNPWWFVSLCFFVRPLTNTNGTYRHSTSWPNPRRTVLNLTEGSSVTSGDLIQNLVSAHTKYLCVHLRLILLHFEVAVSVTTDFPVNWSQCQRPWKRPIFEGFFFAKLSLLRRLPLKGFLRCCHNLFQFLRTERVERWRRTKSEFSFGLEEGPSGSAWLWISRGVSVGAETSYRCRGVCKWQNLGDCEGGGHLGCAQGRKATIRLVVVRRGTIETFRNYRVSSSERIKRCPSASEPRTESHKSAVYWGYHGLHGEWWRLCHKIWEVVWHSSQCVTRWWVENSVPPQTNMHAYWSSPKMGNDCHWCDDIELCSWSGRGSWWDAMQYTGRMAL